MVPAAETKQPSKNANMEELHAGVLVMTQNVELGCPERGSRPTARSIGACGSHPPVDRPASWQIRAWREGICCDGSIDQQR
jgi:hypothetical protein